MNLYYSPAYVGAAYSFETTRKAEWVADSVQNAPLPGVALVEPEPLTWDQVTAVHDPEYVRAVQTGSPRHLAESQGFTWDAGMWPMVLSSNGGVVAAALDALRHGCSGSLSSGLHHARRDSGAGFCTFNGLVIAAREALASSARRSGATGSVLILDLDAHCGGGTASLIARDERLWQVDVAVNSLDYYSDSLRAESQGRVWFSLIHEADEYLGEIEAGLEAIADRGPRFDLCLYNAGMDPFEGCPTGGLPGITRQILAAREKLVFAWLHEHAVSVAFVLAGGYLGPGLDTDGLIQLHRLTVAAAAGSALHA